MINRSETDIMKNWQNNDICNPEVTIWCITFNHEKFIEQCLDGFLMQKTNFPFRIVVHDDASSDQTGKIIRQYVKRFPNIIKARVEEKNVLSQGEVKFCNIMISNVKTKYVATCEGDDFWCDDTKLQKQYDFMEKNQDYVAVGHMTKTVDKDNNSLVAIIDSKPGDYTIKDNEKMQLFAHYSSYFYRNIFMEMSQIERDAFFSVPVTGDRKLPILFMKYGKLYVMQEEMSVYRYMSCPTSFSSKRENISSYKLYIDFDELEKYSNSIGVQVEYSQLKTNIFLDAFRRFICFRSWDFVKILKHRKHYVCDLFICIKYGIKGLKKKISYERKK